MFHTLKLSYTHRKAMEKLRKGLAFTCNGDGGGGKYWEHSKCQ